MADTHRSIAQLGLEQGLAAFEEMIDLFFRDNADAVRRGPDALLAPQPTTEERAEERAQLQSLEPADLDRVLGQKIDAEGLDAAAEAL